MEMELVSQVVVLLDSLIVETSGVIISEVFISLLHVILSAAKDLHYHMRDTSVTEEYSLRATKSFPRFRQHQRRIQKGMLDHLHGQAIRFGD